MREGWRVMGMGSTRLSPRGTLALGGAAALVKLNACTANGTSVQAQ